MLGLILMAVGDTASCLGFPVFLGAIGVAGVMVNNASKAAKTEREDALNKWVKDVTDLARRAEVSNELNRMAQALDEAVKLAVDKLFTQRGAAMEADEKKRRTSAEIQDELERRKKEGFK